MMRFNAFGGFGELGRARKADKKRSRKSGGKMAIGQCKCVRTPSGSRKLCRTRAGVKFKKGGC